MTTCPRCDGKGVALYEVKVSAPMAWRGGYLDEVEMECHVCGGTGEIDEDAADAYDPYD